MKTMNNAFEENKKSEMIAYGIAVVAGVCLIAVGCSQCYKIGYAKGMKGGKNRILDEIVDMSINKGLTMVNSDNERYLFIAEKLTK